MTRPSPASSAAAAEVGLIKRGGDGARWIVKRFDNGVQRWVRIPDTGRAWRTHDNGGSPYQVMLEPDGVSVYARDESFDDDVYLARVLRVKRPLAVVPGTYRGKAGYESPSPAGNSVLIRKTATSCVFVGHFVFAFRLLDTFEAFVSPVGNSDVPYPWLVGSSFIYLLLEDEGTNRVRAKEQGAVVAVPRVPGEKVVDPWAAYYGLTAAAQKKLRRVPITFLVSRFR